MAGSSFAPLSQSYGSQAILFAAGMERGLTAAEPMRATRFTRVTGEGDSQTGRDASALPEGRVRGDSGGNLSFSFRRLVA